jgi:hypothetical protein
MSTPAVTDSRQPDAAAQRPDTELPRSRRGKLRTVMTVPSLRLQRGQDPKIRPLTRRELDGRGKAIKAFDAIVAGVRSDLGGAQNCSTVQLTLADAFAGLTVHLHHLNTLLLAGQPIDLAEHANVAKALVSVAQKLGVKRVSKPVPHLHDYVSGDEVDE